MFCTRKAKQHLFGLHAIERKVNDDFVGNVLAGLSEGHGLGQDVFIEQRFVAYAFHYKVLLDYTELPRLGLVCMEAMLMLPYF